MINSQELRIGNWVNAPHGNVQIKELTEGGAKFTDDCGGNYPSLEPIPLTPELLEAAAIPKFLLQIQTESRLQLWAGKEGVRWYDFEWNEFGETNIKYLHQLQNLYFALTGTELSITFPETVKE